MTPWFMLVIVALVLSGAFMLGSAGEPDTGHGTTTPASGTPPDLARPEAKPAQDTATHQGVPNPFPVPPVDSGARRETPEALALPPGDTEASTEVPEPGRPPGGFATAPGDTLPTQPGEQDAVEILASATATATATADTYRIPPIDGMQPAAQPAEMTAFDPAPVAPPARPSTAGRVTQLMLAANHAMNDLRLTLPKQDNALLHYRQILELTPGHAGAQAGISAIAERYADMAENALQRSTIDTAASYVRRGLGVRPAHARLLGLQRAVAKARRAEVSARAQQPEEPEPMPVRTQPTEPESIVGAPGTGDIVGDFKRVWRAVFD